MAGCRLAKLFREISCDIRVDRQSLAVGDGSYTAARLVATGIACCSRSFARSDVSCAI